MTEATPAANPWAAGPMMLAEFQETAEWLDDKAGLFRKIAAASPKSPAGRKVAASLRIEAARFEGRAAIVRQALMNARG